MENTEPLMLSSLSQYAYCPRRFALIGLDHEWAENRFTAQGTQNHERAHSGENEKRDGVKILRSLQLVSRQYGLWGVADVVEWHAGTPQPVEYKSSKLPKTHKLGKYAEEVQLCAQALCLEEMFGCTISQGHIYHVASHRRRTVEFTPLLRAEVLRIAEEARALLQAGVLPPPAADDRCDYCSLIDECEPFAPREFPRGFDPFSTALED